MSLIGAHNQYDHSKSSTYEANGIEIETTIETAYGSSGVVSYAGILSADTTCVS